LFAAACAGLHFVALICWVVKVSLNMASNSVEKVTHCYDQVAENYATIFLSELEKKPLDQLLLKAFAQRFGNNAPPDQKVIDLGCGPGL
jgi:predicted TPR repeat methyltransferase